jgi:hypothetical protein
MEVTHSVLVAIIIGLLFVAASIWTLFFSRHDDSQRLAARSDAQNRIDRYLGH